MKYNPVIVIPIVFPIVILTLIYWLINRQNYGEDYHIQVSDCKIKEASCKVDLDEHNSIQVNILPRGIPETEMLRISVDTQDEKIQELSVVFEGIEINTITPKYRLYKNSDTNFTGNGFLAVCSLSKMHWIAHLIVTKGDKVWKVSLPFEKDLTKERPKPILPLAN